MKDGWQLVKDEWQMMNYKGWMDEWQMMNYKGWMSNGEGWMMNDKW